MELLSEPNSSRSECRFQCRLLPSFAVALSFGITGCTLVGKAVTARLLAGLRAGLLRVRLGPGLEPARELSQRLSRSNRRWPCNEEIGS
jgi:hypothetical protein